MLTKTFVQCLFGEPFPWTEQYFANIRMLEPYGWNLKVFTPNKLPSSSNIEIIDMTLEQYDGLVEKYCGVNPKNFLNARGVPNKITSDHYPAQGQIFQDYLKESDFWCFTNWDIVYGRLDHFVPDSLLETCDVWSDDSGDGLGAINGIFTLMRNDERTNNLFRYVPAWQHSFTVHEPCAFDEIQMTRAIRILAAEGKIRFKFPKYFPYHSYDRLAPHLPKPNLYFEADGALIERLEDPGICPPSTKKHYGREVFIFHFSKTKKWPIQ